ncbi:MAG: DNA adenine methylase [candidate division Zixibacteria bacterium]|nr:DNA adenine methylase [candidate division Zixibacteria bacterium]
MRTVWLHKDHKKIKSHHRAEPFLKWAGGKGQLLKQYESFFPLQFNNYIEPFVGGGAVFFHLYNTGRLRRDRKITLIDSNEELINCYSAIKEDVNRLIRTLKSSKYINDKDAYYKIRNDRPRGKFERAARTIYLNKTCFNGLYRVNSQGKFNVPFGRHVKPLICDSEDLLAVNEALSNAEIIQDDFERCLKLAKEEDFVYFDPPYEPLSRTSSFTGYTRSSSNKDDQERLYEVFCTLHRRGCKVMVSNSYTPLIQRLYKSFRNEVALAKRAINCKPSLRGAISELVILNYQ